MAGSHRGEVLRHIRTLFNVGTVAGLSDGQLLDRFTAGQGEVAELAVAALIEGHGPMVWRICRRLLRNNHDAEDAFQATFLVLVREARSIRRRDSVASWLHGVALRVASCSRVAGLRRRGHERRKGAAMVPWHEEDPNARDWLAALHEELGRLPGRFRDVAVLCLLESVTHEEAARRLGCPVGTVKSRLATARARLRGRLERRGLAPAAGLSVALAAETSEAGTIPPVAVVDSTIRAAMRVAAKHAAAGAMVSSSVAALTEGVLRAMLISKLKMVAASTVAIGLLGIGVAWAQQIGPQQGSAGPDRMREVERKLDRVLEVLGSRAEGRTLTETITGPGPGQPSNNAVYRTTVDEIPAGRLTEVTRDSRLEDRVLQLERRLEALTKRIETLEQRQPQGQTQGPATSSNVPTALERGAVTLQAR